ncbi:hypothetical protein [Paenibacillus sp. RUD330]|uniref:hypothetical protein n=1 Tax=Paenibacillus sp. RUD330 TaxID=2023772 RepID=UPI000B928F2C|nr:hypothetical protein [Paenibacillus sp. RUD330]ASS66243.1 hypothetical protein CIC07_08830 [Paenibacillus sp. RUD330]
METREAYVLVRDDGLYWGRLAEPTKSLWGAFRWRSLEEAECWKQVSIYRPEDLEKWRLEPVVMTIERGA